MVKKTSKKKKSSAPSKNTIKKPKGNVSIRQPSDKRMLPFSLMIICFLIGISFIAFTLFAKEERKNSSLEVVHTIVPTPTLIPITITSASGWKQVVPPTKDVVLKLEKEASAGMKPTIVVITSTTAEKDIPTYVDSLIKGAQSAIPTLVFPINTSQEKDGFYIRTVSGYFMNGANKINNTQQIYVKEGTVYTVTASFDNQITLQEVQKVMADIYLQYIKK